MKRSIIILVLIFSLAVIFTLKSYSQFTCGGAMPSEEIPPDGNCSYSSISYSSKYNDLSYNIPDENTPIKTILVNINVFQKTNGTGNWQNIPEHIDRLNQVIECVSDKYENTPFPTDPLPGVPYISDSKLRVELSGIYFYRDDDLWSAIYNVQDLLDAIEDEDPTRLNQLNICITGGNFWASGYANYPSSTVFSQDSYIMTFCNEPYPNTDWPFCLHIAHELGHNIQLGHTYNSETCVISHPEFLDDVFGTDPCPNPDPPYCDICYHDAGWDCDPELTTNTCTNNMMGATKLMGYLSPKQMGRIHRSLSIRSVRRYVKEMVKSETPLEVTCDETWDFNIKLYSDLIVKSGATLTITCKVLMPPEGRIIVERNAELIIDGGEIEGAYETMWNGIEVWGDPNQTHETTPPHGVVLTLNGAVIKNAKRAISTTRRDENGYLVNGYHGGIVKADQTTFENNKRAVEIWPYDFENKSRFKRCSFITSEVLPDNIEFDYFIIMSDIEGVKIQGCEFENTRLASEVYIEDRGFGIYSTECQYIVEKYSDPINGDINNQFSNLDYGIKAMGLTSAKAPYITNCDFDFNRTGVYFSGITNGSVLSSDFQVEMFDQAYEQNIYCGLYLDNSTQYHIEGNTFWHDTDSPSTETHIIGIDVNNSGELNNEIYRNTFLALDIGILAQNNNRNYNGTQGLVIKCNDFGDNNVVDPSLNDNTYDVAVTDDGQCIYPGLKRTQGSDANPSSPAGNRFSHASNGILDSDFSNQGLIRLFYYQHDATNEPRVNLIYYNPLDISKVQTNWPFVESECCPSKILVSGPGDFKAAMATNDSKVDSVDVLLDALVDGGNTQQLESEVVLSFPDDAYALHTDLMNKSPYLTNTVMVEVVNKEDVLNPVMVKEILVANPQSAKSIEVSTELANRMNPLPDYMMAEIEGGADTLGDKETMESNKYDFLHLMHINRNYLVSYYKNDTTGQSYRDTLIDFLIIESELNAKYELIFEYLFDHDLSNANTIVTNIPSQFVLSDEENEIYQHYQTYIGFLSYLMQNNKFIYELDSSQIILLDSLAVNIYTYPGAYARNVLLFNDELNYSEPYILPDSTLKFDEIDDSHFLPNLYYPAFKIYPNPAGHYITVEYNIESQYYNGYIEFINLEGKLIKKVELSSDKHSEVIPLGDEFKSGIYVCKIVYNGEVIESEKLSVIK